MRSYLFLYLIGGFHVGVFCNYERGIVESRNGAKIHFLVDGADRNRSHQGYPYARPKTRFFPGFVQRDQLFPSPAFGDQFR